MKFLPEPDMTYISFTGSDGELTIWEQNTN